MVAGSMGARGAMPAGAKRIHHPERLMEIRDPQVFVDYLGSMHARTRRVIACMLPR